MPKIALSYRRADTDAITGRIFDRLALRYGRAAVFRDIDNIPVGVDFRAHVNEVLDQSDIVLVIIGPRWVSGGRNQNRLSNPTDPVRIEVETALRKDAPIIPVLIGRTEMPKVEQLPESMVDFAYRNAVRVDTGQDFDLHMDRLVRAMDGILGRGAETDPASARRPAKTVGLVAVAVAVGLALAIVAQLILWREKETAAPQPYHEVKRELQPEIRDAAGKITTEAATIHVLTCDGPAGNGRQIWLYEYLNRPAFRAVVPPNWSVTLGGRDFSSFAEAARAGCGPAP